MKKENVVLSKILEIEERKQFIEAVDRYFDTRYDGLERLKFRYILEITEYGRDFIESIAEDADAENIMMRSDIVPLIANYTSVIGMRKLVKFIDSLSNVNKIDELEQQKWQQRQNLKMDESEVNKSEIDKSSSDSLLNDKKAFDVLKSLDLLNEY